LIAVREPQAGEEGGFTADQYSRLYPENIEGSYWHTTRKLVVRRKLAEHLPAGCAFLDIGCGLGGMVEFLRDSGFDGYGTDIAAAPILERRRSFVFSGADAFALPAALRHRIGAVLLLDVLEHVPDARQLLESAARAFPRLAVALITLPARPELWSNFDDYNRHLRRYDIASARELISSAGYEVEECGYFFHTLYWPLRVKLAATRGRSVDVESPRFRLAHLALARLLDWEERLVPPHWYGTSVVAVGRVPGAV
jgi:SAM-dependent methyltransferase